MRAARVLAVLAAAVALLVPATPAAAHDGPVTLEVAGDGAGGVTVRAAFAEDGHPVEDGVRLVLTATGEGGRTAGPIQLAPAPEGRGFYASGPVLTPGEWTVTVSAPQPHPGKATAKLTARIAQTRPAEPLAPPVDRRGDPLPYGWLWWLLGGVLVVALLAATIRPRVSRGGAGR
jgi:hypothetical protein